MTPELGNYALADMVSSHGAGTHGQEHVSRRAEAVKMSPVRFYDYYHSHGRSLKGLNVPGIDQETISFLEAQLGNGHKKIKDRGSLPPSNVRYKVHGRWQPSEN